MMQHFFGRYLFGLAAIGYGICTLVWHDFNGWEQVRAFFGGSHRELLCFIIAAVEVAGGLAVAFPSCARAGALALGAIFLAFALLGLPDIVAHPLVYNGYGNFFEQCSFVAGAAIVYACSGPHLMTGTQRLAQLGYYVFGVCVASFGLEQLFYLGPTASLVPKWIPPGPTFWAIATTVAFALAAIAIVTRFRAAIASRLLTLMIVGFGLLVWLPAIVADPRSFQNWSEGVETLGIAASAWIVAEFLEQSAIRRPAEV